MRKIKSEFKRCLLCMEEHDVEIVEVQEAENFKGRDVSFAATYDYCPAADEFLESEEMIRLNSLAMKDAFRKEVGLLTSQEIIAIREKFGISQKDFSDVLDWGRATITRYENHQVQDRAHDDVLRKISSDPKWFLDMLERAKDKLPEKAFDKYKREAMKHYRQDKNRYLVDFLNAVLEEPDSSKPIESSRVSLPQMIEKVNYLVLKANKPLMVGHKRSLNSMVSHGRISRKRVVSRKRDRVVAHRRSRVASSKTTELGYRVRKAVGAVVSTSEGS